MAVEAARRAAPRNLMYRVALTGNIASGKSAVAGFWSRLGAAVVDADELARRAVAPGSAGLARVREHFGERVIAPDGTLDRSALRRIVFADAAERKVLESILHPAIQRLRAETEAGLEAAGTRIVVHVIPLLFEAGLEREFDAIVVVDATERTRLERLQRTRGLGKAEARQMIAAQMPAAAKRERATLVIENDGTRAELDAQARAAWRTLVQRAERSA